VNPLSGNEQNPVNGSVCYAHSPVVFAKFKLMLKLYCYRYSLLAGKPGADYSVDGSAGKKGTLQQKRSI
jgi:hypothetical protein